MSISIHTGLRRHLYRLSIGQANNDVNLQGRARILTVAPHPFASCKGWQENRTSLPYRETVQTCNPSKLGTSTQRTGINTLNSPFRRLARTEWHQSATAPHLRLEMCPETAQPCRRHVSTIRRNGFVLNAMVRQNGDNVNVVALSNNFKSRGTLSGIGVNTRFPIMSSLLSPFSQPNSANYKTETITRQDIRISQQHSELLVGGAMQDAATRKIAQLQCIKRQTAHSFPYPLFHLFHLVFSDRVHLN